MYDREEKYLRNFARKADMAKMQNLVTGEKENFFNCEGGVSFEKGGI